MKELLAEVETAIHDLLLEIYSRDGKFNDRAMEIHNLLIKIKRTEVLSTCSKENY